MGPVRPGNPPGLRGHGVTGTDTSLPTPAPDTPIDVSVCMVSLDCWSVLEPCLRSLRASTGNVTYEVIVVDNASTDRTPELLREISPRCRSCGTSGTWASRSPPIRVSGQAGRYILWLNTDTVLQPDSLARLVAFLDDHPAAGIVGPKVLNADGSSSHMPPRAPTPLVALLYMGGAERLLPGRTPATQYLLSHRRWTSRTRSRRSPAAASSRAAPSGIRLVPGRVDLRIWRGHRLVRPRARRRLGSVVLSWQRDYPPQGDRGACIRSPITSSGESTRRCGSLASTSTGAMAGP